MISPTQRSLALLFKTGYKADVVEYWNSQSRTRHDLFGFIDLVALHPDELGLLGIQTTTSDNAASRVKKIQANPTAALWVSCGNHLVVHGWRKYAEPIGGKYWRCREIWFLPDMTTKEEK